MFQKSTIQKIAHVIVPLALKGTLSYKVEEKDLQHLAVGMRVEVPIGKRKITTGIIHSFQDQTSNKAFKSILQFLDEAPIVDEAHIRFWEWLSNYYVCEIGQVMHAALPAHLKIDSETVLSLSPFYQEDMPGLNTNEFLITEALLTQKSLSVKELQSILKLNSIAHIIKSLIQKRLIYVKAHALDKYKAKTETYIYWNEAYQGDSLAQEMAFELCSRSERQQKALLYFIEHADQEQKLPRRSISTLPGLDSSVVQALVKKEIWILKDLSISRLNNEAIYVEKAKELSAIQQQALTDIQKQFETQNTCLLHGVTGSGKTQLYIELLREKLSKSEQSLYLLPEIALTTQLVQRLQRVFGDQVYVYHSRLNNQERVELFRQARTGKGIFIGPRSAIFLPFTKLRLILIDESHDGSFKQQDPAPRYHGRDAALYLAHLVGAKTLLGTATPSIESYEHAINGKYGLVKLSERYGDIELPEIQLIDLKKAYQQNRVKHNFSRQMIQSIQDCLDRNKQVIVFQNRRGYAPRMQCASCGHTQHCTNCDISLTYHKYKNQMICHYCGYAEQPLSQCPKGNQHKLQLQGYGTEKLEEDLQLLFPSARIDRMDLESARSKSAHKRIIKSMENQDIDILVGTQMISKGLDFDAIELVCVVNADPMIQFPDFRSAERAYQLLTQVAGRAGRKNKKGKVLIQTFSPNHPVLNDVIKADYISMFNRESTERKLFKYPPASRLIKIQLKHKKNEVLQRASKHLQQALLANLKSGVLGPSTPAISRINNYYIQEFLIKRNASNKQLQQEKTFLYETSHWLKSIKGMSALRVIIDIDVY